MAVQVDLGTAQFENMNALRAYPFADGSSLADSLGRELPQDVVVDAHLVVPCAYANPESGVELDTLPTVRMTSVHLSPAMVSVCFVSEFDGARHAVSATVARDSFSPYRPVRLEKLVGEEDVGGIVTFGDLTFPGTPDTYFLSGAILHPGCVSAVRPTPLRKFVDLRSGASVSGNAEIAFSGHVVATRDGRKFALALENGSDAELASECARATGFDACGATPIVSINGIRPDADGNIVLWFH